MRYTPESLTITGKRKTSIAKATIKQGTGKIIINNLPYLNLQNFHKLAIKEVMLIAEEILGKDKIKFDVEVNVNGGGQEGQLEASRLAIAKAIVKFTESEDLKKAYSSYDKNLLVADVRRKEPNKPGDSKARARRQKSFR